MLDMHAKCVSMIDSYKVFQLLLIFSLQFSRILFSSNFSKSCWFECTLWVKSLSYLEHSPSSTNSMSCSIKALIYHLCYLFSIPAMTKKPSIFSLLPIILKENKRKWGTNIIITWPKPGRSGSNMKDRFRCFLYLNLFCIELLSQKEKFPNQGTWMAS